MLNRCKMYFLFGSQWTTDVNGTGHAECKREFSYVRSHEKRYGCEAISLMSNMWIYLQL